MNRHDDDPTDRRVLVDPTEDDQQSAEHGLEEQQGQRSGSSVPHAVVFLIQPDGEYEERDDTEDRQGITEIKHVTGYLAYWDELRRRHPDMLIDSCASGGRRNDLETMRRAVPLWRSDYAFEPVGHQCMTYGISLWLPFHGTGTVPQSRL